MMLRSLFACVCVYVYVCMMMLRSLFACLVLSRCSRIMLSHHAEVSTLMSCFPELHTHTHSTASLEGSLALSLTLTRCLLSLCRCIQSITGGKGRQRAGGGLGIFEKRPQNALTHLKYSQYTSPPESVESSSSSSCSQWCIKQQERRRKSRPTANSPLHFESGKRRRRRIFQQT